MLPLLFLSHSSQNKNQPKDFSWFFIFQTCLVDGEICYLRFLILMYLFMSTYVLHILNYKDLQTICGEIFYEEIRNAVLHQTPRTNTHKCNILEKVWFTCCWVQSRMTVIRKGGNKSWNEPSVIIISYKVLLRASQVPAPQSVRWICPRRAWLSWSVSKWDAPGNCEANGNFRTVGNGII